MIVFCLGKIGRYKGGRIHPCRLFPSLGNEIISVIRIRIPDALDRSLVLPAYRSLGIEIVLAINNTLRHFLQIIKLLQFTGYKRLILQISAIAINLHLIYIRESGLAHHGIRQLMNARLAHSNLSPCSRCQDRMVSIERSRFARSTAFHQVFLAGFLLCPLQGLRLDIEHKAHQRLISVLPKEERRKRNHQDSLLAAFHHLLVYHHLTRQNGTGKMIIMRNIISRHIDIFRIFQLYGINGILIITLQGIGIDELRQDRVYLHFIRSEVKELLCRNGQCHEEKAQPYPPYPKSLTHIHIFLPRILSFDYLHIKSSTFLSSR